MRLLWALLLCLFGANALAATYVDTTTSTTTSSTTISASLGSYTTGNYLVCSVAQKQNSSLPSMTTPAGWTSVFTANEVDGGGFQLVHNVYVRETTGSEGSTLSITSSDDGNALAQCVEVSGTAGLNASATAFTEGQFTTTPSVGAITTDEANELVLIFLSNASVADPFEPTVPTSTTLTSHLNNGTQIAMSGAYFTQASAGSTGTQQWADGDASVSNVVMFAMSPDGGGGSVIPVLHHQLRNQ